MTDPVGWDDIPVECKAEFQRAMIRHPAGSRGTVIPFPQHPPAAPPVARERVLYDGSPVGTFLVLSTTLGLGILIFALYFGLVN